MSRLITTAAAFSRWENDIKPLTVEEYGHDDTVALSESWNDYSDSLCKDGELSDLQYNFCPAYDDGMPGDSWDDEIEHLLDSMDVKYHAERITARPDGLLSDMPADSSHWEVSFTRGSKNFATFFSQGPFHKTSPDVSTVLGSLIRDMTDNTTGAFIESEFAEWAENLGFDADSRKGERAYHACLAITVAMRDLFGSSTLDDLREIIDEGGY